ncbi:ATP-dependent Clp protease proteolytic subunit 6, chloroplastic isoform X2 [Tanacetum coccineum]|uniref:ATP-dependent Clp protease proteolytic subunit 6, chloroplastic isoform X2 n=1 Tax=Tanacetum coccineum TaxID=301880 RepID=A0ABQ5IUX4_9ASTR
MAASTLSTSSFNFTNHKQSLSSLQRSISPIVARRGAPPPIMPAVMTPGGPLDLSTVLFRNRIIFVGQPINSQVAQRVISQLVTLATIDENADILGHVEDVRRQVNEAVQSRHKIDMMYAAFTGQPLEKVQQYTERDRFLSVSEWKFGVSLMGILENAIKYYGLETTALCMQRLWLNRTHHWGIYGYYCFMDEVLRSYNVCILYAKGLGCGTFGGMIWVPAILGLRSVCAITQGDWVIVVLYHVGCHLGLVKTVRAH